MNSNTRKKAISPIIRKKVMQRDGGCIFCKELEMSTGMNLEIMHYISRGEGGLGVEENLAVGCILHHRMLDQTDLRSQMKSVFREYLMDLYPDWDEDKLRCRNRWESTTPEKSNGKD